MPSTDPADPGAPRDPSGATVVPPEPCLGAVRLAAAADSVDADFLRHVAAVTHEHLVPTRLLDAGPGPVELVRAPVPLPGLAALLAERGSVAPGECVTILVPIARAVAAVHAAGLVVGGLGPADVHLDRTGRAALSLPRLPTAATPDREPGSSAEPWDEDVRDLGRLGWTLLSGTPPASPDESLLELVPAAARPLVALVSAVLDAPAGRLPTAAELATTLIAACPPEPVRLPPSWGRVALDDGGPESGRDDSGAKNHAAGARRGQGEDTDVLGARTATGRASARAPGRSADGRAGASAARRAGGSASARGGARRRHRPAAAGRRRRASSGSRGAVTRVVLGVALSLVVATVAILTVARPHVLGVSVTASAPPGPTTAGRPTPAASRAGRAPAPTAAAVTSAGQPDDWRAVLADLDRRRADALERPAHPDLARVDVPGSPAFARDQALTVAYAARGAHLERFGITLLSVASLPPASIPPPERTTAAASEVGRVARLLVKDRLPGYDVVGGDGRRLHRAGRGVRAWALELRAVAGEWRIWDIQPAQQRKTQQRKTQQRKTP